MGNQTTKEGYIYFPDGAQVLIKEAGAGSFTDLGVITTAVTNTLNWEENVVNTANRGQLQKQIRNMTMEGGFTLISLDPNGIQKLSGGFMQTTSVPGSSVTSIDDQTISAGWSDVSNINLSVVETGSVDIGRLTAAPVIASVTADSSGALTANDDYTIVADTNSSSGYSIVLNTAGTKTVSTTEVITIEYTSAIPVASTVVTAGSTTAILEAAAMQIKHTDDNGKVRKLDLYAVDTNSGGFQFNFKGANEDGVEEMPLTFTAKLDTSRTSGDQLFSWTVETGAE
jgi:hypothetical protein